MNPESVRVPAGEGRAFSVAAGQRIRITMSEGAQVGDLTVVNLHNHGEGFSVNATAQLAGRSFCDVEALVSGPPHFRTMLTLEANEGGGTHFLHGRCTTEMYRRFYGRDDLWGCHENIVNAYRELGVEEKEVPLSTFNLFMKVILTPAGTYHFYPPTASTGAYVDFRAQMDVAVALSACPHPYEVNAGQPKPLDVEIADE